MVNVLRIVINPHIGGYGHRVRCNLIAEEIMKLRSNAKISFLDRKDDPLYNEDWTEFKRVRGGINRTIELIRSTCLVEDSAFIRDFQRKIYSKLGKIVTITNPNIESEATKIKHFFRYNDLIIIPYPKDIFPFPNDLIEFKKKLLWVNPVLNLPPGGIKPKKIEKPTIYITASRGREKIMAMVEKVKKDLPVRFIEPSFRDEKEYFSSILSATAVITQGTTVMFELCYLGIPQICIPFNKEQLLVAKKLSEMGIMKYIPLEKLVQEEFKKTVTEVINESIPRSDLRDKGRDFIQKSGAIDIAKAIVELAEL